MFPFNNKIRLNMKRLKATFTAVSLLLPSILFYSCQEPFPDYWSFRIVNNSVDTIGITVLEHKLISQDNSYICIQNEYPILPSNTITSCISHDGGNNSEIGTSWSDYFNVSKIDTLCIIIYKKSMDYHYGDTYELPQGPNILKIYKYYDKNTDLKAMVSPTITYP